MLKQIKDNQDKIILTEEGLADLNAELKDLKEVQMPKVVARIANARDQGDLSENSDYHSALDEQAMLNARIDQIENIIDKSKVVKEQSGHLITLGSKVKLKSMNTKKTLVYSLVGQYESDPQEGKISIESPVGKSLLGKKKGDKAVVETPAGKIEYLILDVS
ncbi:MAG: transcription elongation factor GreA [Candidatus Pacebacteria bacterium]|jgi:transcription elongation factor GreA|nr:transcription elongation factor GreA [Candidatus Paceibacterota bacterium]